MRLEILPLMLVMAITTYLIRMLPTTLFRKKIRSRFAKRFFYYIPYAVLAAMLIPAAFYSTGSLLTAIAGIVIGVVLSLLGQSLLVVALSATAAAFLIGLLPI